MELTENDPVCFSHCRCDDHSKQSQTPFKLRIFVLRYVNCATVTLNPYEFWQGPEELNLNLSLWMRSSSNTLLQFVTPMRLELITPVLKGRCANQLCHEVNLIQFAGLVPVPDSCNCSHSHVWLIVFWGDNETRTHNLVVNSHLLYLRAISPWWREQDFLAAFNLWDWCSMYHL